MTQFWFGFISAVALIFVTIVWAALVASNRKAKEGRRQLHALLEKPLGQRDSIAKPDLVRLQELIAIEAKDGLTTAEAVEFNAVLQRLQKAPIALMPSSSKPANSLGKKGIH